MIRRQARVLELALPAVDDRLRGGLVADPVANPIGVPGPHNGLYAVLHDVGKLGEKRADSVARGFEGLERCVGACLIHWIFCADGFEHSARLEILGVQFFRRVWIAAQFADIVRVKVTGHGQRGLDVLVADVVRLPADGIRAGRSTGLKSG
ncbi:MAG: hypothetical protein Q9193_005184 [Seirophora villosa]